jgi:hypothetical protein
MAKYLNSCCGQVFFTRYSIEPVNTVKKISSTTTGGWS